MNRTHTIVVAVLMLWTPGQSSAGVFQRDWKTPGDGLLTYDDVNQREWLDVTQTRLSLFPPPVPVPIQFDVEARYQRVVSELLPGGMFEGFAVATSMDVIALAESAGIDTATNSFAINGAPVSRLIALLDPTFGTPPGLARAQGLIGELAGIPFINKRLAAIFHYDPPPSALFVITADDDSLAKPQFSGVMLYRVAVPEPSGFGVACVVTLLLYLTGPRRTFRSRYR